MTDSTTAGVYDTIYVDLDNDYRFDDEKPVTKASPASYRDMDGDGYTDLSGGLLYYISDGTGRPARSCRAARTRSASPLRFAPGEMIAWTGDFDPAIGGHGTQTASNIVGQGVINGLAPTFSDVPGGTYPGAVIGGAPARQAGALRRHLLLVRLLDPVRLLPLDAPDAGHRRHVELVRLVQRRQRPLGRRQPGGRRHPQRQSRPRRCSRPATARPATARTRRPARPPASASAPRPSSAAPAGTRSTPTSQIVDDDVDGLVQPRSGRQRQPGVDVVADGAFSAGDITLNTILDGQNAWDDLGRDQPLRAGRRRRHGPGLPVVPPERGRDPAVLLRHRAVDPEVLGAKTSATTAIIQGAGSVDAAAGGDRRGRRPVRACRPDEWRAGDYRGSRVPRSSATSCAPAAATRRRSRSTVRARGTVSDRQMVRTDSRRFEFSSKNLAQESVVQLQRARLPDRPHRTRSRPTRMPT